MGATGPVNPIAAGQPPGRRPGGWLAALPREAARAPFTARARRELLFCLIEVPLGLVVLAVPIVLTAVPLTASLLAQRFSPSGRPVQAHPAGVVAIFGGMLVILLLLVILAPRAARGLGAWHRHLAARLLGERVAGPPPVRTARGVVRRLDAALRDGPGWRAVAYLLLKLPVTAGEMYAVFLAAAGLASLTYPFWWRLFRIHPPALDNGLSDALATLAAGSAIPVELTAATPRRPTPAIETIAYFCAAELLANAAKHSGAGKIAIEVAGRGTTLVLRVRDDGRGGADPAAGSGLSGLAQRVSTVDGRMEIVSPPGGPTRITVTLPLRA